VARQQRTDISSALNSALEWLSRQPIRRLVLTSIGLLALISLADFVTPPDVAMSVGYMIPVVFAASGSRRAGLAIVVLTDVVWSLFDAVGRAKPYSGWFIPYWNAGARLAVLAMIALLVTTLTMKLARETGLSRTDSLTGLPNGRAFHEATAAEIHRMRRTGQVLTAAYVDVDNFKAVNDALGHPAGDALLMLAARTMTDTLRGTDVVARMGGDEFALLLPGATLTDATARLRIVHNALNDAVAGTEPAVGFSIGAVTFTEPPHSGEHLIARADRVMYDVKQHGKNTVWAEPAEPSDDSLSRHNRRGRVDAR
jgi:diguanylate cyclase (GGDEF)-like protein